ncbi:hypothetical protein TcYC6_0075940 [Trypanosoma cruzi]|uniref:Uncharacterized protein n=1 Tax=Trypanosoma cruzi TaxID=5693 RepID=A0A7J6Y779_TRYCR|nr:hypothetical protein ECC02_004365 [Trypanosoma cruzi]KAF8298035.1 hypothetical protein TcYC6_0075940 [Trypanosoma cruzi]
MISESDWRVVGTYRWRSLYPGYTNSEEQCLYEDAMHLENIPILLYDTKQEDGVILAPRYVARKVSAPQASCQKVKVLSGCAQPRDSTPAMPLESSLNCGTAPAASSSPSHSKKFFLVVGTTLPQPPHTVFVLFLALLLADIAVTATGVTTTPTSPLMSAVCCLAALGPDVVSIGLILRRERNSTFAAIHVVLWPCLVFLFLFPFISMVFIIHFILSAILLLFLVRFRVSSHTTFFTFQ